MNSSRQEYLYRLNRVLDYIESRLDDDLNLCQLAELAAFSPFHFHRIFSALTGETPNNYIRRKRLERAASLLLNDENLTVTEASERCGFRSASVFCRAFREYFGASTSELRENPDQVLSKIHQSKRKIGQLDGESSEDFCSVEQIKMEDTEMNENIELKEMAPLELLYCTHTGPFHLIGQAYGKLMKWAGPRGLLASPDVKTVTVYHDDPTVTSIEKLRQSACITVKPEVKAEGEFGRLQIPGGKHVVGRFEIGPEGFEQAWNAVCQYMSHSGYQPSDGKPYELYHNDHEKHPERKFILDICIPVKPL